MDNSKGVNVSIIKGGPVILSLLDVETSCDYSNHSLVVQWSNLMKQEILNNVNSAYGNKILVVKNTSSTLDWVVSFWNQVGTNLNRVIQYVSPNQLSTSIFTLNFLKQNYKLIAISSVHEVAPGGFISGGLENRLPDPVYGFQILNQTGIKNKIRDFVLGGGGFWGGVSGHAQNTNLPKPFGYFPAVPPQFDPIFLYSNLYSTGTNASNHSIPFKINNSISNVFVQLTGFDGPAHGFFRNYPYKFKALISTNPDSNSGLKPQAIVIGCRHI